MSVPVNAQDFTRFKALADLLKSHGVKTEMSLYIATSNRDDEGTYVSIEMKGFAPQDYISEIFND